MLVAIQVHPRAHQPIKFNVSLEISLIIYKEKRKEKNYARICILLVVYLWYVANIDTVSRAMHVYTYSSHIWWES